MNSRIGLVVSVIFVAGLLTAVHGMDTGEWSV